MQQRRAVRSRLMLMLAVGVTGLASAAFAFHYTFFALVLAGAIYWQRCRRWSGSSSHGTATFTSLATLEAAGLLDDGDGLGLPVGRVGAFSGRVTKAQALRALFCRHTPAEVACGMVAAAFWNCQWIYNRIIYIRNFCHVALLSRSGGGKGVGLILPLLLSYRGSVCVLDPKAENFLTACNTRRAMGHRILLLDPMGLAESGTHGLNPLAFINPDAADFGDECRDASAAIIVRSPEEKERHFNDMAELVISAVISFVVVCSANPEHRNLKTVQTVLLSIESFETALELMLNCGHPVVETLAGQCTSMMGEERGSIFTTIQRALNFLTSDAVAACVTRSDFHPRDLKRGKVSLFIAVPPKRMSTWAPLLRVWISCLLNVISDEGADESHTVLFILDEIGQLERFSALEKAASIMRGYGIRLLFVLQSSEQLKTCFGDRAAEIQDNISTLIAFNISSLKTAEELSNRIGNETIRFKTPTTNTGTSTGATSDKPGRSVNNSSGSGTNVTQQARKLLMPDEIIRQHDVPLIFHEHLPVIAARKLRHFADAEFQDGRMGRQQPLSLGVSVMATLALVVSVAFAVLVIALPVPQFQAGPRRRPVYPAGQAGRPPLPGSPGRLPSRSAFVPTGSAGGRPFDGLSNAGETHGR